MFVLLLEIDVTPGTEKIVFEKLAAFPEIVESYLVTGGHDIIAIVETESMERVFEVVMNVRRLKEVVKTKTLPVVKVCKT